MPEPHNNTAVMIKSDETEIINYLRETERQRLIRAKIEDIRTKMKAQEAVGEGEYANLEPLIGDSRDSGKGWNRKGWYEWASQQVGNAAKGVGSGLKNAPNHGVFIKKNQRGRDDIWKHISGDTFGWDRLSKNLKPDSKDNIYRPAEDSLGKVAIVNHLGTVLLVVGVAMDVYEVYTCVIQDYEEGTKHRTAHAVSGIAGSYVGAWQGAAYGAAVGSTIPVVGSIAGGVMGGLAGSMGGSACGRYIAEILVPTPTVGQCAFCRKKFTAFAVFYLHFIEHHKYERQFLFAGVLMRAGEERANIEDTWFTTKAFILNHQNIDNWNLAFIYAFNDRMMKEAGWDVEEDRRREEGERMRREMEKRKVEKEQKRMREEAKKRMEMLEKKKREEEKKMGALKIQTVPYHSTLIERAQPLKRGAFEDRRILGVVFTALEAYFYFFP